LSQLEVRKQFLSWKGQPLFWHSAQVFARIPSIQGISFVFPEQDIEACRTLVKKMKDQAHLGIATQTVTGGQTRQDSVFSGLLSVPSSVNAVLIHDAARPFLTPKLVQMTINALSQGARAVIPVIPITDTIKQVFGHKLTTLPREHLVRVQTPQGFALPTILQAHHLAREQDLECTDDAGLCENMGEDIEMIVGEDTNIKITTPQDLMFLKEPQKKQTISWSGWGYDVHRYGPGRPMKLGGIPITNGPEVQAHSDGDVLLHAIIDALLGCLGQGDIGEHFPDSDPTLTNINSSIMLAEVLSLAEKASLCLDHLDATLVCQIPRLTPWKRQIKENLSRLLTLPPPNVNIKATTEEGLGFTGDKQGIKAIALLTVHKRIEST
jgi:2-C-methyl-D-erythritol 4-phosphate cytidylyltransferase/2-C-methyl-D-erythritol 2,4-cyclodiphosphate synthase